MNIEVANVTAQISIDFGSAFTKVAVRHDLEQPSRVLSDPTLNLDEQHICIPSAVASAERGGQTKLAFGLDAVDMEPSDQIKVYRNWKSHLFGTNGGSERLVPKKKSCRIDGFLSDLDTEVQLNREREEIIAEIAREKALAVETVAARALQRGMTLSDLRKALHKIRPAHLPSNDVADGTTDLATREVALQYFKWLRGFVEGALKTASSTMPPLDQIPVRVCVPAFVTKNHFADQTASEEQIIAILEEAGWNVAEKLGTISEPFANAIGTLTNGENATRKTKGIRDIDMPRMFTNGLRYLKHYRERTLQGRGGRQEYVFLVVDVGAYTTDLAVLRFDLQELEDYPRILAKSQPLGISRLDALVAERLPEEKADWLLRHANVRRQMEFRDRVYSERKPYSRPEFEIGAGEEGRLILDTIRDFAGQIAKFASDFFEEHGIEEFDELILTGGGSNIPVIPATVYNRLHNLGLAFAHLPSLQGKVNPKLRQLSADLVRGASALGGASAYIDYAQM